MSEPLQILLVDDNPGDVDLVKAALRESSAPFFLHVAWDGLQALEFLRQENPYAHMPRPDLIFLDLNLPRKNGREVLRIIKQDPRLRLIPVVVLTTSDAQSDVLTCYEFQANSYVIKPACLEDFTKVVGVIEQFWFKTVKLPACC